MYYLVFGHAVLAQRCGSDATYEVCVLDPFDTNHEETVHLPTHVRRTHRSVGSFHVVRVRHQSTACKATAEDVMCDAFQSAVTCDLPGGLLPASGEPSRERCTDASTMATFRFTPPPSAGLGWS